MAMFRMVSGFVLAILTQFLLFVPTVLSSLEPIDSWSIDVPLTRQTANHQTLGLNNFLINFGGSTYDDFSLVEKINTELMFPLRGWVNEPVGLPQDSYWHAMASKFNRVYLLGGTQYPPQTSKNFSIWGEIDSNGDVSHWSSTTLLPQRLSKGASTIVGNYIYFSGGWTDLEGPGTASDKVYYSLINQDGTLGVWNITTNLPSATWDHRMVSYNEYVYIVGGWNSGGVTNSVLRAKINSDGSLSSWTNMASLPKTLRAAGVIVYEDYIIVVGGVINGGVLSNLVYYSQIDSSGTITSWNTSVNLLPINHCCGSLAAAGGYLYLTGGYTLGYEDRVWRAKLNIEIPFPTPTPTPSPIPTPTPEPLKKVILIPGMGASWNADALLNCKSDGYDGGWTMSSFAAEIYQPLISTLNDDGIEVNMFNYDWRKEITTNQSNLQSFIDGFGRKVALVGHSMGGLLGRAYLEASGNGNNITDLITVGSPHRGSSLSYPAWSGGEIWNNDLLTKIAATLFVKRCSFANKTDREVIQTYWPSIHNLLPIDDYLKNRNNVDMIPVSSMSAKNNWQPTNFQNYGVHVGTLSGVGYDTLQNIIVKNRSKSDAFMGNWDDGKPIGKEWTNAGDGVVLASNSSLSGFDNRQINGTHLGIINSAVGVSQILNLLNIATTSSIFSVSQEPKSALVVIGNNAKLILADPMGKTKFDTEGVASVINPKIGRYKYILNPKKLQSEVIIIQVRNNGEVLYKEEKFSGILPKFGTIDFL